MLDYDVHIKNVILKDELFYDEKLLLNYKIEYPHFISVRYQDNLNRINEYYKSLALKMQSEVVNKYFNIVVNDYMFSVKNNLEYRKFEILLNYNVTYNKNCVISIYFDKYEYMGGAHGLTIRFSDTWNIQSGNRIKLDNLFIPMECCDDYILDKIYRQIEARIKSDSNYMYFNNYIQNVVSYFEKVNFYLANNGVVVYFQIYSISPYASGIPEFFIPYSYIVISPRCR